MINWIILKKYNKCKKYGLVENMKSLVLEQQLIDGCPAIPAGTSIRCLPLTLAAKGDKPGGGPCTDDRYWCI